MRILCWMISLLLLSVTSSYGQEGVAPDSLFFAQYYWTKADSLVQVGQLKKACSIESEVQEICLGNQKINPRWLWRSNHRMTQFLRRRNKYADAHAYAKVALVHSKKYFTEQSIEYSNDLNSRGLVYLMEQKYDKAKADIKKAYQIRKDNKLAGGEKMMINLGILYGQLDSIELSGKWYFGAIEEVRRFHTSPHPAFASCYQNVLIYFHALGDYEQALTYADSSFLCLKEKFPDDPTNLNFADHYNNLSVLNQANGNYRAASENYHKAIEIYQANTLNEDLDEDNRFLNLAAAHANFGLWLYETADYNKALLYFQKSLSIRKKYLSENHSLIGRTQNYIGNCYLGKNDLDEAEKWMESALAIRQLHQKNAPSELADSYQDIGKLQQKIGFWKAALNWYEKALAINREIFNNNHPYVMENYRLIGQIYLNQNSFSLAAQNFQKALNISQQVHNNRHPDVAEIYQSLAACYPNNLREAQQYINKAFYELGYFERGGLQGINSMITLLQTLQTQARLLTKSSTKNNQLIHLLEADEIYNEAFILIDSIKIGYTEPGSKQSLLDNFFSIYEDAIKVNFDLFEETLQESYLHRAFQIAEQSNNTLLVEALNTLDATTFAGIPDSLIRLEKQLKFDIARLEKQRFEERQKGSEAKANLISDFTNQIFDFKEQHHRLLRVFTDSFPRFFELKYESPVVSVLDIQAQLQADNRAVVEYFVGERYIFVFVITKNNFEIIPIEKDFPLESWVEEMRSGIYYYYPASPKAPISKIKYTNIAIQLFDVLIEPIAEYIQDKDLVIIPGGVLGYLPFEALLTNEVAADNKNFQAYPYLLNHHAISYNYSATHWQKLLATKEKIADGLFLGFAPNFDGNDTVAIRSHQLGALKFNLKEIEQILKILKGRKFFNEEATVENFLAFCDKYRILHLATHGVANDQTGDYSFLAFYQNPADSLRNDILYVKDIYNLELMADMVVLSACETAIGEFQRGEGIVGLARGFFYAGAESIITTLWRLDDKSSLDLMPAFYRNLKAGMTKDKALQLAKLSFIQRNSDFRAHPLYWAAFVPVGNMEVLDYPVEEGGINWVLWVVGILMVVVFGYVLRKRF